MADHDANTKAGGRSLSIGDIAKRSGVAVSALRFYETRGLIQSTRNPGNQRRYRPHVLRRVAIIKTAQNLGIPLSEIAEAMASLPPDRTPTEEDWLRLSEHWRSQLTQRIDTLLTLRDHLQGCIGCGCLSLRECPLRNPADQAARAGPGARLFDS